MKNKLTLSAIEDAFLFVNMSYFGDHTAYISKKTGEIYYSSESGDYGELPDDDDESAVYIEIPHKNDLDLGKDLVFQFVSGHIPEEIVRIEKIFSRKGAYSRYKAFLEQKGLLEQWYDYENRRQSEVLRQWCKDNNIAIID
jgi:hypothetical protein